MHILYRRLSCSYDTMLVTHQFKNTGLDRHVCYIVIIYNCKRVSRMCQPKIVLQLYTNIQYQIYSYSFHHFFSLFLIGFWS